MAVNSANIRQYLRDAYSDDELTALCSDHFYDVCNSFTAGMTKEQKIELLLDYCRHRNVMPNLLAALAQQRSDQYQERFGQAVPASAQQVEHTPTHHTRRLLRALAIILAVLVIAIGSAFAVRALFRPEPTQTPTPPSSVTPSPSPTPATMPKCDYRRPSAFEFILNDGQTRQVATTEQGIELESADLAGLTDLLGRPIWTEWSLPPGCTCGWEAAVNGSTYLSADSSLGQGNFRIPLPGTIRTVVLRLLLNDKEVDQFIININTN